MQSSSGASVGVVVLLLVSLCITDVGVVLLGRVADIAVVVSCSYVGVPELQRLWLSGTVPVLQRLWLLGTVPVGV